ncbi:MAG: hypothetical protein GY835_20555 [bacterium]|nr:hypothetical protein [bacterium]
MRTRCLLVVVHMLLSLNPMEIAAQPGGDADARRAALQGAVTMMPEEDWALDADLDREQYVVGPGDRILLVLDGKRIVRVPLTVLPEGILDWEGGLHLTVSGLTLAECEGAVQAELAPILSDVAVSLLLLEPRKVVIHVLGEVNKPGAVELRATDRISTAILAAGGTTRRGSRRFIELKDGYDNMLLDLYPFTFRGDWRANPYLPSGKVLFVPLKIDTVSVVGEINRPAIYEWREGETLGDFLDYAGGLTQDALRGSILLERDEIEVEIRMTAALDRDLPLRPGDVLVVGSRKPLMNRVFIEGAGERRGEIYLSPDETLGDLVHRLGDTRGQALPEQAVLERMGTDRNEFIQVNLREVLQGEGPVTLPIKNDDVLYVPRRSQQIFVLGQVNSPGPIPYIPSRTAGQYLAMAGGTTSKGSTNKLKIINIDGVEIGVDETSNLHRGDVLIVGKSRWALFSEVLVSTVSITSLVVAITALARNN